MDPLAIGVVEELGIDISANRSKHIAEFADQRFDLVVTVCDGAKESCPVLPGARRVLHWPFEDPAAFEGPNDERRRVFRRVRDEIGNAIRAYLRH